MMERGLNRCLGSEQSHVMLVAELYNSKVYLAMLTVSHRSQVPFRVSTWTCTRLSVSPSYANPFLGDMRILG